MTIEKLAKFYPLAIFSTPNPKNHKIATVCNTMDVPLLKILGTQMKGGNS